MTSIPGRGFRFPLTLAAAGLLGALALGTAACSTSKAAELTQVPPGEAWLTRQQIDDAKIRTEVVADHVVDDSITTSGRVTFDDLKVAHIFSPAAGRVVKIDAQLGERVKKGQTLSIIDSPDVGSAISDIGKAKADLVAAQHDFDRKQDLLRSSAVARGDYEGSEDNLLRAKAEMDRAVQRAALFHTGSAGSVSSSFALTSPIAGEVVARMVNPGAEVQGQYGQGSAVELFTVGELDTVWVLADVYEADIARIKPGARAQVSVVSTPGQVFAGRIDWISGALDPVSRTAKIRCVFDNPGGVLKPEMYAKVTLSASEVHALAIPRSAVVRMGEQTVVFVERGATPDGRVAYERLPVTVDEQAPGDWLPVTHGLDANTRIVTAGATALTSKL